MINNFFYTILTAILLFPALLIAQDAQELAAEKAASKRLKGEHPLVALMNSKPFALKKELQGVHPRVFVTQAEIDALKAKSMSQKEMWQTVLSRVRAMSVDAPPPPAETRRAQNEVGIGIAEAAFVYKITGDKKYLDAARKYMDAAVSYDVWGYSYNKPNVDLAAGHLLYGLGWGYDLLYNDLTEKEREKYRNKLIKQGNLLADFFMPRSGKSYAYSQNHTFIPITGLAIAAYALEGESRDAVRWAKLSRAIYDRVLATYSQDGYYYEGMEYWIFSMPWMIHYMDAHKHATGEDLYALTPGLRQSHTYVAHATLPGGEFNFDFGDIYAGNVTRSRKGDDYERERIDGHFRTNYNILYNLAKQYNNAEAQGVANWLRSKGQVNAEEVWTFIWFDPKMKSTPMNNIPTSYYFRDHEVVYWRSSWRDDATAFAFKSGPPEGHAALDSLAKFPDWRLSSGHAHPDAGSFIIWSKGKYLTGDSGYAGVPMTEHHNAVTFDGQGQGNEGKGHDAFSEVPYDLLNKIRLSDVKISPKGVTLWTDLVPAYMPSVGVNKFVRKFEFRAPGTFTVTDSIDLKDAKKITSYLHADNLITNKGRGMFDFEPGKPSLMVTLADFANYDTVIEKNILTAPGRPGSVDKGEREERGTRLAISPRTKSKTANIRYKMKIQ